MKRVLVVLVACFLISRIYSQNIDSVVIKNRLASLKSSVALTYNEDMLQYLKPLLANENHRTSDMIYEAKKYKRIG